MKPLLRAMRSKELVGYVEGEARRIEDETLERFMSSIRAKHASIREDTFDIQYNKRQIRERRDHIKELKAHRKETLAYIKDLEANKDEYVREYGYEEWSRSLERAYDSYAREYELIKESLETIGRRERQNKRKQERITWEREHLRNQVQQLEKLKKEGLVSRWALRDVDKNRVNAAVGLSVVFGPNWQGWLSKMERRGIDLHDATYWLPTVESIGLDAYLTKYWQAPIATLAKIARGWNDLEEDEQQLRPRELAARISSKVYKKARSQELAMEAALWGVKSRDYYRIEDRWLRALMKKGGAVQNNLPQIDVRDGDYRMYRLEKDDPRALFLGEHTDCCQSVGNVGDPCTWFGVEDPNSGFYVIEDRTGNIIAQSWAWIAGPYLVFDSIEGKSLYESSSREERIARMYEEAARQIMDRSPSIREVRTGVGQIEAAELESPWQVADEIVDTPKNYGRKYSDARGLQYIIGSNMLSYGIPGEGKSLAVGDIG